MNSKHALALSFSTVLMLGMVSCFPAQNPADASALGGSPIADEPPKVAPTVQEKIAFRRKTLRTMGDELVQISALVKAARFGEAQATFEKALKKWYTFGGTVKRIAPSSYAKISPNFEAVKKGLYQSSVPLSTLKANLQTLIQDVKVAIPISDATE
jgi:hypothetical protein